jgi:Haem-binding uptake, Tiki superfamily, ChaN
VDAVPTSVLKGVVTQEPGHYELYQRLMHVSPAKLVENPTFLTHFDRMYQVQCFREEYMAESVLLEVNRHLKHPQGHWTAVLAGENHILGRGGIPSRALRRLSSSLLASTGPYSTHKMLPKNRGVFTIMPRTIAFPMVANEAPGRMAADYVWYVENDNLKKDQVNASPFRHQT